MTPLENILISKLIHRYRYYSNELYIHDHNDTNSNFTKYKEEVLCCEEALCNIIRQEESKSILYAAAISMPSPTNRMILWGDILSEIWKEAVIRQVVTQLNGWLVDWIPSRTSQLNFQPVSLQPGNILCSNKYTIPAITLGKSSWERNLICRSI